MRSLDFEDASTLLYTRLAFGTVAALGLSVVAYLYTRIRANQDPRVIRVPPPALPSWASSAECVLPRGIPSHARTHHRQLRYCSCRALPVHAHRHANERTHRRNSRY